MDLKKNTFTSLIGATPSRLDESPVGISALNGEMCWRFGWIRGMCLEGASNCHSVDVFVVCAGKLQGGRFDPIVINGVKWGPYKWP